MSSSLRAESVFDRLIGGDTLVERQARPGERPLANGRVTNEQDLPQSMTNATIHTGDRAAYSFAGAAAGQGVAASGAGAVASGGETSRVPAAAFTSVGRGADTAPASGGTAPATGGGAFVAAGAPAAAAGPGVAQFGANPAGGGSASAPLTAPAVGAPTESARSANAAAADEAAPRTAAAAPAATANEPTTTGSVPDQTPAPTPTPTPSPAPTPAAADQADAPTLTVQSAHALDGHPVNLDIAAALTDPKEVLSITIGNLPAGATLSAGTHNADGTWTLTTADLQGLKMSGPPGLPSQFDLAVTATSREGTSTASVSQPLHVTFDPVADAPTLATAPSAGLEDHVIPLSVAAALSTPVPGEILSITIGNVPAGFLLSAGTRNADGTWTLAAADLNGLTLTTPSHFTGNLQFSVEATSSLNGTTASTAGSLAVTVDPIAHTPLLATAGTQGPEDTAIPLTILAAPSVAGETLTLAITGLPPGSTLSAGTSQSDGSWTLTPADLQGLTLTPPHNYHGDLSLTVTATSHASNGATSAESVGLPVIVTPVADAPILNVQPAHGREDVPVPLAISAALTDPGEVLSLTIGNLPTGVTLSAGTRNADGSWTLAPSDLQGLTLTGPGNLSGSFDLSVTATSREANGSAASTSSPLHVILDPIGDAPSLAVQPAHGREGSPVALSVAAAATDSGEVLSITIGNLPTGATLSAGTHNPDGTWTLTAADLQGLTLSGPPHLKGSFDLVVTATSRDGTSTENVTSPLHVILDPVADAPTLAVQPAHGLEGSPVALNVAAALTDPSELLSVTIGNLPAGATLSAGTRNPDGTWTLTAADLQGLTLTGPGNLKGSFDLAVTATSREVNGSSASTAAPLHVILDPVADAPTLAVQPAHGLEGNPVALSVAAGLSDPSEFLSITIANLPAGATLSAGTHNPDGSWTLTAADLQGLTLTGPAHLKGAFDLAVTATSREANGSTASVASPLHVIIDPVADAPTLAVQPAHGLEGSPVALNVAAALTDPSELLSITIGNLPAGATLSAGTHNPDGTWTLTSADLQGLTLTGPGNLKGSFDLAVTATSREANGSSASTAAPLHVILDPVADAPTLAVQPAHGLEGNPVALSVAAGLSDPSEFLSITIANLPAGATLSAGTHNPDGSWTLAPSDLQGLTLTGPAHLKGAFDLAVTATSREANGSTASVASPLHVIIDPVADAPTLAVQPAHGLEGSPVSLNVAAALTDPSETLSVTIGNLPAGATLSAGTHNADGTWTLATADLQGLTLSGPTNLPNTFDLAVTATSRDGTSTASVAAQLHVTLDPIADAPTLTTAPAHGLEDQPVALSIAAALSTPVPGELLSITISGVPTGFALSAGTRNTDGTWTLAPADLSGLTLSTPANYSGNLQFSVQATSSLNGTTASTYGSLPVVVDPVADAPLLAAAAAAGLEDNAIPLTILAAPSVSDETLTLNISGLPQGATLSAGTHNSDGSWTLSPADLQGLTLTTPTNYHGSLNLTVTAVSTASTGSTASQSVDLPVQVAAVADTPNLAVQVAHGQEGHPVALNIAASLNDSGEILSITVANLPSGATLSAGTHNANGSWTLAPSDLQGLTLTGPGNLKGGFDLAVTATSREANGSTASVTTPLHVTLDPVADTPSLTVSAATGLEDTAIALTIAASSPDPTESLRIVLTGVPAGATLSAGSVDAQGNWTLHASDLSGLTLTPPHNFSGPLSLSVSAITMEGNSSTASASATLPVTVVPVADAPTLTLTPSSGLESGSVALQFSAALTDPSETLSVTITGVPTGATLSAGTHNPDGSWTVAPSDVAGLQLTPVAGFSGRIDLTVTATSSTGTGSFASTTGTLPVTVAPVAETPIISTAPASGPEDTAIALHLGASLPPTSHHDTLAVTITGVPDGATLSAGVYGGNGTWTLTPDQLTGLTLTPPHFFNGTVSLNVEVSSTDGTALATASTAYNVTVTPVAYAPTLTVSAASGLEDTAIALNIGASIADPSDHFGAITITGVPTGATLSAGTHNQDGSWTLAASDLQGLTLTPPANSNVGFTLGISATSIASDGSTAVSTASLAVSLTGVADGGVATAANVTGTSGQQIALSLGGSLIDTDGSETLTYVVHGVPDGFALTHGSNNGDNTWTLTQSEIAGVALVTPDRFNGQLTLYLTAVSHENDGDTKAGAATSFTVGIGDVAHGYLIDLGLDANVGGIGAGAHVGALPPIDLFPASGGLLATNGVYMKEDTPFQFNDAPSLLNLQALNGLQGLVARIEFSGIPAGATLSAGTNRGNGVWWVTPTQLTGLTLTPPPNSDVDFTIVSTARLVTAVGVALTSTYVHLEGIADTPTLTASSPGGAEGTAIPLNITGALTDTDGSETLSYAVSGLPTGFKLSAGIDNGNGSWTLHAADLQGLTVRPPAFYSGTATITVSAVSTERKGDSAVTQASVALNVTPVASGVTITSHATGTEDQAVPLNLAIALRDNDGSETLASVTISGLPPGAHLVGATDNGNGTWSVDPAHLSGVSVVTAAHFGGDFTLTVTAVDREISNGNQMTTVATIPVHVTAVATAPTLSVQSASGQAEAPVALNIASGLVDTDGSEALTIVVSGLPAGAVLSAGAHGADGSWTLTPNQLAGLTIQAPHGSGGDYTLHVTAISHEIGTALDATTTASLALHLTDTAGVGGTVTLGAVTPPTPPAGLTSVAAPDLHVSSAVGFENTPINLNVTAGLLDHVATESLGITISGMPSGASLSAGTHNPDGSWTLNGDQLAHLTLQPPAGSDADFTLHVTATAHDAASGLTATSAADLSVTVLDPISAPSLSVSPALGTSTAPIHLSIATGLTDPNPSDVLSVTIGGVPGGASLSAGTHNVDGSWTLTPDQLTGLTLTPQAGAHDSFTLSVSAHTHETLTGQDAVTTANLGVTIADPATNGHLLTDPASFMAALDHLTASSPAPAIDLSASAASLVADSTVHHSSTAALHAMPPDDSLAQLNFHHATF